jgi:cytochrome c oxidase subunit 4
MTAQGHSEVQQYVRTYMRVFGALLALTVLTVAAASVDLAIPLAVGLALVIAGLKGSLVAGFFMHLIAERQWIYAALILTGVLLVVLVVLPLLVSLGQIGTPTPPWTPPVPH